MLEDCDPEALGVVVDFMYGTELTGMVMMHSANTNFVPLIVRFFQTLSFDLGGQNSLIAMTQRPHDQLILLTGAGDAEQGN